MKNGVFALGVFLFVSSIGFSCQRNPVAIVPLSQERPKSEELVINGVALTADSVVARALVSLDSSGRMAHFLEKCKKEAEVSVGFIGGSITWGASVTQKDLRYSSLFCTKLRTAFPKLKVNEINAGIGATNSRFGCSRLRYDILSYQPDLVVVEYAVNDNPAYPTSLKRAFEGLLRQCLVHNDTTAVMVVLLCEQSGSNSNHPIHTAIAQHYKLPVVSYLDAIWPVVQSNQILWDSIAADVVHPNNNGHNLCATYLYEALRQQAQALTGTPGTILSIPEPLYAQPYSDAHLFFTNDTSLIIDTNSGWKPSAKESRILNCTLKSCSVAGFSSDSLNDQISFSFAGAELTLGYYKSKNLVSMVEVSLNGVVTDTLRSYFENDWGPGYMKTHTLFDENKQHMKVQLRNISGGHFEVMSLMYAL